MSRSIHKTKRRVYGGKSKKEIRQMIEEEDPDHVEYEKKKTYKKQERNKRSLNKGLDTENKEVGCDERKWLEVKKALEQEKYKWRTIKGVAREIGFDYEEILCCLNLHSDEIIKSSVPSNAGEELYTTRRHYRSKSTIWGRLESSILNKVMS